MCRIMICVTIGRETPKIGNEFMPKHSTIVSFFCCTFHSSHPAARCFKRLINGPSVRFNDLLFVF